MTWVLNHIVAICQDCPWTADYHGVGDHEPVLAAARRHSRTRGHYVQVERGQHAHYGLATHTRPERGTDAS